MIIHSSWQNVDPTYEVHLRRANEARAAAVYAAWRRVTGGLGGALRRLAEAWRRAARARRTREALRALSDRQLDDIGLARGEIADIARAIAEAPPERGVTLAELGRLRPAAESRGAAPGAAARQRRPAPWAARRPADRAADARRAA